MTRIIHSLIADANPILRAGIKSFLNGANSGIKVVGEAGNREELLELVHQTQPHLVLLDFSLAYGDSDFDLLGQICAGEDHPNIVVMMADTNVTHIIQALLNGAVGAVTKDVTNVELRQVVNQAAQTQRALSSTLVDVIVDYLIQCELSPPNYDLAVIASLTDRELEVFNLVAQGLSNKEIAENLSLSVGTVKSHVSSILGKLQVNNRAQAALLAIGQLPQDQLN